MIWFVDLSPHPHIPIQRRAVPSSAPDVRNMGDRSMSGALSRAIPDASEYRRWVRAATAGEALCRAQDEVMRERTG